MAVNAAPVGTPVVPAEGAAAAVAVAGATTTLAKRSAAAPKILILMVIPLSVRHGVRRRRHFRQEREMT
jgi:hypothetical protein